MVRPCVECCRPMRVERDDARQRLVATGTGTITVEDIRAVVDQQHAEGLWHYALLYDVRGARTTLVGADLRSLAAHTERLRPEARGPVAVVTADPTFFGMSRMYAVLTEPAGMRFAVFQTMSEAEQWLDQRQRANAGQG